MLKGEKVYLRLVEQRDINILYSLYDKDEAIIYEGDAFKKGANKEFVLKNFNKIKHTLKNCLSIVNEKKVVVGCVVYNLINEDDKIYKLGIIIGKRFRNRGYGKDVLFTLIRYLFENEDANLIKLEVLVSNKRAINCYKKVGFTISELRKDSHTVNGESVDSVIMILEKQKLERKVV